MDMKFTTNCVFRQSLKPKHEASTWKQREIRSGGRSNKKWGFKNLIWSVISSVSTFDNTGLVLVLGLKQKPGRYCFWVLSRNFHTSLVLVLDSRLVFSWYMAGMYLV
jgi:hypothetical protein